MDALKGYFMALQNFSVNDGDGIRTTVFFAGCPLTCEWCANPEGLTSGLKIAFYESLCIECGACVKVCPNGVGMHFNDERERLKCNTCGACVGACQTGSRKSLVFQYDVSEILTHIERQELFYKYSGGGVTFSGGEATSQLPVLKALTDALYDRGISMSIETCGYFQYEKVEPILKKMDLIFVDIKHMDDYLHLVHTGVGNQKILNNIQKMKALKIPVVIRMPLIDGFNTTLENIKSTARFVKKNFDDPMIELLPYHAFGNEKYTALGIPVPKENLLAPKPETIETLIKTITFEGIRLVSYK